VDVATWRRSCGKQQYESAFRGNAIDTKVLPDRQRSVGGSGGRSVGHRRKPFAAIAALRSDIGSAPAKRPTRFELSPSILSRADEVIE
jgi:hypothetical protein